MQIKQFITITITTATTTTTTTTTTITTIVMYHLREARGTEGNYPPPPRPSLLPKHIGYIPGA